MPAAPRSGDRDTGGLGSAAVTTSHHSPRDAEVTGTEHAVPTVRDRLRAAGLSAARIATHAEAGTIRCDGALVTDLDQPAPPGTRLLIGRR